MKTAILTDSAAIIDPQVKHKLAIHTISLPLLLDGKQYYEKYDDDRQQIEQRIQEKDCFLTFGQMSVNDIDQILCELCEHGYTDVIWIYLNNELNGLGDNLYSYQQRHSQIALHLFDSHAIGVAEGKLAIRAAELAAEGHSWNKIKPVLEATRNNMQTMMILKNLRHIKNTGYVKNQRVVLQKLFWKSRILMTFNMNGQLEMRNVYLQQNHLLREIRRLIMPEYQRMARQLQVTITAVQTGDDPLIPWIIRMMKRTFPVAQVELYQMNLSMISQIGMDGIVISWGNRTE